MNPKDQHEVFNGILQVLQRIEAKLETHETRVKQVEDLIQRSRLRLTDSPDSSSVVSTEASSVSWHRTPDNDHAALQRRASSLLNNGFVSVEPPITTNPEAFSVYSKGGPKIRYGDWRSEDSHGGPNELLDDSHFGHLEKYLGHCAIMPDDHRLPLNFNWTTYMIAPDNPKLVDELAETRRLEALRAFDVDLRAQPGNDFLVVDFDTSNNSRIYRVGQEAIGAELMVSSESPRDAPWSRLMYDWCYH